MDKIGNHKNVWSKYCSCYATINSEIPKEETSSGAIWDESKMDFTIRYSREVDAILSIGFRVIFYIFRLNPQVPVVSKLLCRFCSYAIFL